MLVLQYGSGMDPLLSYYSFYLGLGIGMILMILCFVLQYGSGMDLLLSVYSESK